MKEILQQNDEVQDMDLTGKKIAYLLDLNDRWEKATMVDDFAALRTRGYVALYGSIHHKDIYDINRIYQSIQHSKWLKELYLCILNEYLTASKMELEVAKKTNIELACQKLQEAINLLKGV